MKHLDPIEAHRSAQRAEHGRRVEERQRVNGQPNGYRPVSEHELREGDNGISQDVMDQKDNISLSELYSQERKAKGWQHHEESDYWK